MAAVGGNGNQRFDWKGVGSWLAAYGRVLVNAAAQSIPMN